MRDRVRTCRSSRNWIFLTEEDHTEDIRRIYSGFDELESPAKMAENLVLDLSRLSSLNVNGNIACYLNCPTKF